LKAAEYENGTGQSTYLAITYATPVPGDINQDYAVDLKDAIISLRILSTGCSLVIDNLGDVDGDKRIGLPEIVYILNEVAK